MHGLDVQEEYTLAHVEPTKPVAHAHVNAPPPLLEHDAPFAQGADAHASTALAQAGPKKPGAQLHEYPDAALVHEPPC